MCMQFLVVQSIMFIKQVIPIHIKIVFYSSQPTSGYNYKKPSRGYVYTRPTTTTTTTTTTPEPAIESEADNDSQYITPAPPEPSYPEREFESSPVVSFQFRSIYF